MSKDRATKNDDTISQGGGADTLIVSKTGEIQQADVFKGGSGIDTILLSDTGGRSFDLSAASSNGSGGFLGYEAIAFNNTTGTSTVTLTAGQFGTGKIARDLTFVGDTGTQVINIRGADTFTAANFSFTDWTDGTDLLKIQGTKRANTLTGSVMDDIINGYGGQDTLLGGAGDDTLAGGAGIDTVSGGEGDDVLIVEDTDALIDGGTHVLGDTAKFAAAVSAANLLDTDFVNVETVLITNTTSAATYDFSVQTEALSITGDSQADTIIGGTAGDTITGGAGADSLSGGAGDDIIVAADDDALIDGGAHTVADTARFAAAVSAANLLDADLVNIEKIEITNTTSAAAYNFSVQTEALIITGNSQADTITGGSAGDTITGAAGADSLSGGAGDDILVAADDDVLIDGGAQTVADTARFAAAVSAANLLNTDLVNVEKIEITNTTSAAAYNFSVQTEALIITGNSQADTITGGTADDTITGAAGADSLTGGAGNDILVAADDDALIDGGADTTGDTAQFAAAVSTANLKDADLVNVEKISITNTTSAASYNFSLQTEDLIITGNSQADTITGGTGDDTINGGAGADVLDGGGGANDFVYTTASNSAPAGGIDTITGLDFNGATGDQFDFTLTGTLTTATDTLAFNLASADTVSELQAYFNSATGTANSLFTGGGNATAILVAMTDGDLLVVDVNGDGDFTAADAVIEVDYTGTFGTALFI